MEYIHMDVTLSTMTKSEWSQTLWTLLRSQLITIEIIYTFKLAIFGMIFNL